MQFFTSGFFWFIEGIFLCLIIIGLKYWTEERNIPMPFWKWLVILIWILYSGFTIAFIGTCLGENEPAAALKGGMLFSLIAIVSAYGLSRLLGFFRLTRHQPK
ncbi:MAG: hypothetical protein HN737_06380 [Desulfobacterales bacterium]|mgnify:FL=1|jgi:hypothetical protein|nr:hypothetical protein [Desulfobacteraceae bacterium]MBT4363349.1 hypothetical protein [Desulfobacteraceae bacterium]MBT7085735.1 hypothetical protein [Desulfobacterales bacterium]MBT7697018.1 hypothetical protein [Desulfobacterales bacterium]